MGSYHRAPHSSSLFPLRLRVKFFPHRDTRIILQPRPSAIRPMQQEVPMRYLPAVLSFLLLVPFSSPAQDPGMQAAQAAQQAAQLSQQAAQQAMDANLQASRDAQQAMQNAMNAANSG